MHPFLRLLVAVSLLAPVGCGSNSNTTSRVDPLLKLAQCMRSHGVPNFPDPGSDGRIELDSASGLDLTSPASRAAQAACKAYAVGKAGPPAMSAAERQRAFVFAKCMRTHGQSDFPDPTIGAPSPSATGRVLALRGMFFAVEANFNPKTPAFRQAAAACGVMTPGS